MSQEIIGLFATEDAAKEAEKALIHANFSHAAVQVKTRNQSVDGQKLDGLDGDQTMVLVIAPDVEDERQAINILHQCGATNLSERVAHYHANRLIPDPDYTEPHPETVTSASEVI